MRPSEGEISRIVAPRSHTEVPSSRNAGCGSSRMDDCLSSIKLIYRYLDGELDTKGSFMVQPHIRGCSLPGSARR